LVGIHAIVQTVLDRITISVGVALLHTTRFVVIAILGHTGGHKSYRGGAIAIVVTVDTRVLAIGLQISIEVRHAVGGTAFDRVITIVPPRGDRGHAVSVGIDAIDTVAVVVHAISHVICGSWRQTRLVVVTITLHGRITRTPATNRFPCPPHHSIAVAIVVDV